MRSNFLHWLGLAFVLPAAWAVASVAGAKEAAHEFLDRLRDRGYGEVTLDYLAYLKEHQLVPDDVESDWDLYQARAWRLAIAEAFNPTEVTERREKAQSLLEKYLKEHPDSVLATEEVAEWGTMSLKEGLRLLDQAQASKDPERKAKLNGEARAVLAGAKTWLTRAVDMGAKQLAALRSAVEGRRSRRSAMTSKQKAAAEAIEMAEFFWLDAKFKLAKADFFEAETFADEKKEEDKKHRTELLQAASASFYDIYQGHRTTTAGLLAHTWEGKTQAALGDLETAQDMYEEVLVLMPDTGTKKIDPAQENLFCEVKHFSLLITLKRDGDAEFLSQAESWLKDYKAWNQADGYQAIMLEAAKIYTQQATAAPADQQPKLRREAKSLLQAMLKVSSGHHQEARTLLRSLQGQAGEQAEEEPKTLEEATALGNDAADSGQWEAAVKWFTKAQEFAEKLPNTQKRRDIQTTLEDKLDTSRCYYAYQLQTAGKGPEAIALAKELLAKLDLHGELAPKVGAVWVRAALHGYATASDAAAKQAALTELTAATKLVVDTWPDKAEADDARIALGQASLVQGKPAAALEAFEQVNQRSPRYPLALLVAAQTHLRVLDQEQKTSNPDPDVVAKELAAARQQLEKSIELQSKETPTEPSAVQQLFETRLLLSQVYLLVGEPPKAIELLQPIVDSLKDAGAPQLDATAIKAFSIAVNAYVAAGQLPAAGSVASILLERGQDSPTVNKVLIGFARTLQAEYKLASAAAIEAQASTDAALRMAAEPRLAEVKELAVKLLTPLSARTSNTPANLIFIGDLAMQTGQSELAGSIFQRILDRANEDPEFAKQYAAGLIRVRSQLIELLREKKEYAEGVRQADTLIEQVPKALEPLMAKGRLLQAWAEEDPSKFPDAVAHWASLRQKLESLRKKPAEYYEVNYNVALCLYLESQKTGDPSKALDAQKVLNALLITAPKLDGPDTVAQYKELLRKLGQVDRTPAEPAAATEKPAATQ
ncbi:MAG TPA: hypothetical protein VHY91_05715 [Pirellulales bacterium]|jgi:hypothetical protein|nr:hypothetical protein [Pirellulales bacterium]